MGTFDLEQEHSMSALTVLTSTVQEAVLAGPLISPLSWPKKQQHIYKKVIAGHS